MEITRCALGMRMDEGVDREGAKRLLLEGLKGVELDGLTLWGGEADGVFTLVIMGGKLKRTREIYRRILDNREFTALLLRDMPFIENNRVAKLSGMTQYAIAP